jgi:hypothetical protein
LPEGSRKQDFSVHADFTKSHWAESLGNVQHTLSQLGETRSKCVSCHNAYQIRAETSP